jgi:sigma-B regulation protein RsbU (phosphoserine phosphatase)
METTRINQFLSNLQEKRENLAGWLKATPAQDKRTRLGPAGETGADAHLQVLEETLEKAADQTFGICEVCHGNVDTELLELDYTCCVCLDHFSEPEKRQLEEELELSASIQKAFLPQEIPAIPGMELAAINRPAQILSGDYFDFLQFKDGSFGMAIADVVGHGVSAGLIMASMQTVLRTLGPDAGSLAELVERANHFFIHNVRFTTFVTLFIASYNPETRTLTYCNAGHNPILLHRAKHDHGDGLDWLEPTGAAIGLVEDFQVKTASVQMEKGDVLLLYTDGIPEAINTQGVAFGRQRLAGLVEESHALPVKQVLQAIRKGLDDFTRGVPLADDITLVAGKVI